MAQIAIEHLTKSYGQGDSQLAAIADLSLEVAAGEFVTLLGPSGCGKTTTLRLLAGYLVPDSGRITIDGRVVSAPGDVVPPERRNMGMVFQNYAVWPHKTVFENVVFGLRIRKVPDDAARARVGGILDLVNLAGMEHRYPSELSGGQQQRVALARSLVVEPQILLLDEPLSNLDAKLRERMRNELKQLQRRTGITFVYVTHDQSEALTLSDRIAVIHAGKLRQYGTPREIYRRPADRIVADFMGQVNFISGFVREIGGGRGIIEAGPLQISLALPAGIRQHDRVELAIRPESISLVPAAGDSEPRGRIEELSYLGSRNEYVVCIGDLRLRVQANAEVDLAIGTQVVIWVDPEACNVYSIPQ